MYKKYQSLRCKCSVSQGDQQVTRELEVYKKYQSLRCKCSVGQGDEQVTRQLRIVYFLSIFKV